MADAIRAVVFDVGGVLVEFTGPTTLLRWLGGRSSLDDIWRLWLASPAVRAFERGLVGPDAFADQLITDLQLPVTRTEFLADFAAWPRAVFPGAHALVRRIEPRYVRATLTNTNVLHWPRVTGELGLGDLFDHHFASHLLGRLKPDREVFVHVVERLACDPSAILFLDDQPLNVEAALASGLQAVRVRGIPEAESALIERGVVSPGS
jgi:putative hydrolase of the HAD superfamily